MGTMTESFAAWCRREGREKLLELYDEAANGKPAEEIPFSSSANRIWRCPDCGMTWQGSTNKMNRLRPGTYHVIRKRREETWCPYCQGKRPSPRYHLCTEIPWSEKFWDTERNGPDRTPERYLPGSHEKFYLRCPDCGYRFPRAICLKDIHGELRCPDCGEGRPREVTEKNCLAARFPKIAAELAEELNSGVTGRDILPSYQRGPLWFRCSRGHLYRSWVDNRANRGDGCPRCGRRRKTSFIEQAVFYYLQMCSWDVQNNCLDARGHSVDILLPDRRMAVEYDSLYYHRRARGLEEAEALARALEKHRELSRYYRVYVLTEWTAEAEALSRLDSPLIVPLPVPVYAYTQAVLEAYDRSILELLRRMFPRRDSYPNIDIQRDELKILAQYVHEPIDDSFERKEPQLSRDWDWVRNGPLTPAMFPPNALYKFHWICRRCGRSYRMSMANRRKVNPDTCPCCCRKSRYPSPLLWECYPQLSYFWDEQLNEVPFGDVAVASERYGIFRGADQELVPVRICNFSAWLRKHPDQPPEAYLRRQAERRKICGEATG